MGSCCWRDYPVIASDSIVTVVESIFGLWGLALKSGHHYWVILDDVEKLLMVDSEGTCTCLFGAVALNRNRNTSFADDQYIHNQGPFKHHNLPITQPRANQKIGVYFARFTTDPGSRL